MHTLSLTFAALLLLASTLPPQTVPPKKVVAYVPNWIDLKSFADTIDYAKITHLNLAFENPTNDSGDLSFNDGDNALIAQAHTHHVKVLVSIGGGAASGDKTLRKRYSDLLADANRAGFVAKIADYLDAHHFDGLDVDIEGPAITTGYAPFVSDLAAALKPRGKLLTAALSQGYGGDQVPSSVFQSLDFVNIMAYDGTGPWDPNAPGQHSSFALAQSSVVYWLERGLPKSKAVLGVPFYGYGFGDAFRNRDYSYADIVASYPGAENADQVGKTIWYNGIPTIRAKTQYVVAHGLAGVMIWSLDSDAPGKCSLLTIIDAALHPKALDIPRKDAQGKP